MSSCIYCHRGSKKAAGLHSRGRRNEGDRSQHSKGEADDKRKGDVGSERGAIYHIGFSNSDSRKHGTEATGDKDANDKIYSRR